MKCQSVLMGGAGVLIGAALALGQATPPAAPATTSTTRATSKPTATKPAFTLGKETTRLVEPLRADGRPDYVAALDRIYSNNVTPENNAVNALLDVFGTGPTIVWVGPHARILKGLGITEEKTATFQSFDEYLKQDGIAMTPELQAQAEVVRREPWDPEKYPDTFHWLAANDKAIDRIAAAASREHYYWPLITRSDRTALGSMLLPGLGPTRNAAFALTARGMERLRKGQAKEAQADVLAAHRLGRLLSQRPAAIERTVAVSIESVAARCDAEIAAALNAEEAKAYLAALAKLPPMGDIAVPFDEFERYAAIEMVLCTHLYGPQPLPGQQKAPEGEPIDQASVDWNAVLKRINGYYDRLVATLHKPTFTEYRAANEAFAKELAAEQLRMSKAAEPTDRMTAVMIGVTITSSGRARGMADAAAERMELAKLALALAEFRGEKGTYPEKLAELVPAYLAAVPNDLFTDAPLKYRQEGKGFVLYSIGPNLVDDGGTSAPNDMRGDLVVKVEK